jgi:hypothetical protein
MSLSLYTASIPVFQQMLQALSGVLDKAAAHCAAKKIDPTVLAATRLIPDMFALTRQVQTACDFAKNAPARIAGIDPPKFEDRETTIDELKARIAKTLDYIGTLDRAAIEAAAGKSIEFPLGPNKMKMQAENYLLHLVLPNFFFHTTTAYGILRQAGVDIGKRDFIGMPLGISPVA